MKRLFDSRARSLFATRRDVGGDVAQAILDDLGGEDDSGDASADQSLRTDIENPASLRRGDEPQIIPDFGDDRGNDLRGDKRHVVR